MFELKSYSRKELAMLYFPGSSPQSAYCNLRRWLLADRSGKTLYELLRRKKLLSRLHVKAIVDILGEP